MDKEFQMSKTKRYGAVLVAACLMVAAASQVQAHQQGSIGSANSEYAGPFASLWSLITTLGGPKGPIPPPR